MLTVRKAKTLLDYLYVRILRNENRQLMTRDTSKIGLFRQIRFWWNMPQNVQLYVAFWNRTPIGYMALRDDGDTTYITEVVSSKYRNLGVGTEMVSLAQSIRDELVAEILADNVPSIRLHERCGFVIDNENPYCKVYLWKKK